MSLYKDSTLAMLPTAYKDGKLYSVRPTDGSGDFTFSRGTTATRVASSGYIEKGRENLLLQSNTFDTTWTTSNAPTLTSGQSGYDGSSDAWKIELTAAYGQIIQSISISGLNCTSIYAKAGTINFIRLRIDGSPNSIVDFNLTDGSTAYSLGNVYATSTSVGGGWYRLSMVSNVSSSTLRVYPLIAANDLSGTSGNIYIQDAQLEQGLVARDYIETTTAAVEGGITDNVPRLDYTDSSCPALLLEPQRTNLIDYSEWFGSSNWTKQTGITITDNTTEVLSPEGKYNAAKIVSADATKGFFDNTKSSTAGSVRSIYLRGAVGGETALLKDISGFGGILSITLTTDWVRYELATSNTGDTYRGLFVDNISVGTIYAYGAQWEEGSYATSYIPTYGSSVTRNVETCLKTGVLDIVGQSEGTLFAEFEINADNTNGFNRVLAVGDGTSNNRIFIFAQDTEVFRFYVANGGAAQVDIVSTTSILGGRHKVAFAYKANDFIAYVDGVQVGTDTSGTIPSCSNVYIGTHEAGSTQPLQGGINQALLFKTRLTNAELADLTTL